MDEQMQEHALFDDVQERKPEFLPQSHHHDSQLVFQQLFEDTRRCYPLNLPRKQLLIIDKGNEVRRQQSWFQETQPKKMPDLGIVARYFRDFIYHCYWHIKTKIYRKNDNLMNHLGCYPPQINKTLLLGCHSVNDTRSCVRDHEKFARNRPSVEASLLILRQSSFGTVIQTRTSPLALISQSKLCLCTHSLKSHSQRILFLRSSGNSQVFQSLWMQRVVLNLEGELLQELHEAHDRRIQKIVAYSSGDFGQSSHQFGIGLCVSFEPGSVEQSQRLFLQLRVIQAEFELARVVELGDLLELLVQVFDESDGVFGLGVGELVELVIMSMVV